MKKLVLLFVVLLAGCGDSNYVEPVQPKVSEKAQRAYNIACGFINPTDEDFATLDVAPIVNGISQPNGKIDMGDVVVLLRNDVNQPQ